MPSTAPIIPALGAGKRANKLVSPVSCTIAGSSAGRLALSRYSARATSSAGIFMAGMLTLGAACVVRRVTQDHGGGPKSKGPPSDRVAAHARRARRREWTFSRTRLPW